jgi:hypothetical protein
MQRGSGYSYERGPTQGADTATHAEHGAKESDARSFDKQHQMPRMMSPFRMMLDTASCDNRYAIQRKDGVMPAHVIISE